MNIPIPRLATALCVAACLACGDPQRGAAPPAAHDASSRAPTDEPAHGDDAALDTPRPHAVAAHADDHADDHVRLTPEQLAAADLEFARVQPGTLAVTLDVVARVSANLDAQAHVNPRVGGTVRAVHASLGDFVEAGDPLCEIDSVELGRAVSQFLGARATLAASEETLQRERELLTRNLELARTVFERELDLAEREITTLSARYDAERAFQEAQLRLDARMLELEARLAGERLALAASERELEILGMRHEQLADVVARAGEPHAAFGAYLIRAPRDGIVVARDATLSEYVDPQTTLFDLQDPSRVWLLASVYEQQLSAVREGAAARVRFDAFPDVEIDAVVALIDHELQAGTRSLPVRLELDNPRLDAWPERWPLRPGMYARAAIEVRRREAPRVVPESAVVHGVDVDAVFVRTAPGEFERRVVTLGDRSGELVELLDGAEVGEQVVTRGAFQLESARRGAELGGGHGH